MIQWIAVAAGGAVGATLRHAVNQIAVHFWGADFPWGTLAVNILGSFIMGVFVGAFALFWDVSQTMRLFLTVGVLGGFTTFSAFSLDSVLLLQRGQMIEAVSYILGSVILSLGGLVAGMMLVRMVPA